jgi:hypothetical protein
MLGSKQSLENLTWLKIERKYFVHTLDPAIRVVFVVVSGLIGLRSLLTWGIEPDCFALFQDYIVQFWVANPHTFGAIKVHNEVWDLRLYWAN